MKLGTSEQHKGEGSRPRKVKRRKAATERRTPGSRKSMRTSPPIAEVRISRSSCLKREGSGNKEKCRRHLGDWDAVEARTRGS